MGFVKAWTISIGIVTSVLGLAWAAITYDLRKDKAYRYSDSWISITTMFVPCVVLLLLMLIIYFFGANYG